MADEIDVLLVEDNPDDAEFTLRALRKANVALRVALAEDGVKALEFVFGTGSYAQRAGATLPRVVLLDLKLPKIDGLEVLRRIKSDTRTRALPIVVLTSSREEQDLVRSYDLGVNAYVVKPVEFPGFIEAVKAVGGFWAVVNEPPPAGARA